MATNHISDGHRVDNGGHGNRVHTNDGQTHFHHVELMMLPKPSSLMGSRGILPAYSPPPRPFWRLLLSPVQLHASLTTNLGGL